ncbi:hypothetical protein BH23BAC1_BH23BAC1_33490 [soil metagenome]
MKKFYILLAFLYVPFYLSAQLPILDPTFGEGGTVTIPYYRPHQVLIQDDKKILVLAVWD